ncbi:rab-GTPase-TBC domain-containing protein [Pilobolus umbonatus]|nr:rab-GTPase-TBC domain-containing protein [Pilobolus umbonatus]
MDTGSSSTPEIWVNTTPVDDTHLYRNQSSQMSTHSDDTGYSIVTATHSSIHTTVDNTKSPTLKTNDKDLRHQYEQEPERIPDVATEMEKWYALTDRYGFLRDTYQLDAKAKEKEVERAEKWAKMSMATVIEDEHVHTFTYTHKFKKRVFKGIPDCWRRDAWYYMITDCLTSATNDNKLRSTYETLLQKESPHERQIDLDIPRTLRDHIMFKQRYGSGQRALFNVLRAFANYDEEVGYCQGMTNIVATILMYCEEELESIPSIDTYVQER